MMQWENRFKPFTLVYYCVLLMAALWSMNRWVITPLMNWTSGKVQINHIMAMWIVGLVVVCATAVVLTKMIMNK